MTGAGMENRQPLDRRRVRLFLQQDPLPPRPDEMNAYIYVRNNPTNYTDCSGMVMCKNDSGVDLPYKHEGDDNKRPRTCKSGEVCDVDGFYTPDHRVIQIHSYTTTSCRIDKDLDIVWSGYVSPCEVAKDELDKEGGEYGNWPSPYSGRHWPYELWP